MTHVYLNTFQFAHSAVGGLGFGAGAATASTIVNNRESVRGKRQVAEIDAE